MKIFIVEDDSVIQAELNQLLVSNGYEAQVVSGFSNVLDQVLASEADLVLLDLNLPGVDGIHLCREIRAVSDIPIIVVTSRDGEVDEVMCMKMGADDFVTKPYSSYILLARIEALLRRTKSSLESSILVHNNVELNIEEMKVSFNGKSETLTKNELRILSILMKNSGKCVSRQNIMYELWSSDEFIDDNTLTVNVNRLRQTLARIGVDDFVVTHRGQGYSLS